MINTEIKRKELRDGLVFYCGYCAIQDFETWLPEIGYNYGIYGWNCTVYAVGRYAIATGYRPDGRFRLTLEQCKQLTMAAKKAIERNEKSKSKKYPGDVVIAAVYKELSKIHAAIIDELLRKDGYIK